MIKNSLFLICFYGLQETYPGRLCSGFKLVKKFKEKFCLSLGIFGRSFCLNFKFAYIFYTFSLLPQLKIGRFVHFGRLSPGA